MRTRELIGCHVMAFHWFTPPPLLPKSVLQRFLILNLSLSSFKSEYDLLVSSGCLDWPHFRNGFGKLGSTHKKKKIFNIDIGLFKKNWVYLNFLKQCSSRHRSRSLLMEYRLINRTIGGLISYTNSRKAYQKWLESHKGSKITRSGE